MHKYIQQDKVKKGISQLEQATHMVNELGLFSRNEEIEECPTADIRYLLLPAFLGDMTLKFQDDDRLSIIQKAKAYFRDYIRRCRDYGVTKEEIPEEPPEESDPIPRPSGRPNLAAMQSNREAKIRRYKEAKELNKKLTDLGDWEVIERREEDVKREFFLLMLKKWVSTSLEQLNSIQQEIEILQHMAKMKKGENQCQDGNSTKRKEPPPKEHRKPMKPFILTKDALQAQVFGAGYPSIPTMTIDDFYQKEIREGKIQLGSMNQPQMSEKEEVEAIDIRKEREIEQDDPEALRKSREWDEWKDDHKRGWGNRENRS
nr:immunoglobulin-binding protein 1-like [Lytechinus pictus]